MLTPSSPEPSTNCMASTPIQVIRFPHTIPAPADSSPPLTASLPYWEAVSTERHQTMVLARQILQAAYPFLEEQQWIQALDDLQLRVYFCKGEVTLNRGELTTLVQYLAACYPQSPAIDIFTSPVPLPEDNGKEDVKQTFSMPAGLALQLKRVAYWKRDKVGWVVQQALALVLRQYPEAFKPTLKE